MRRTIGTIIAVALMGAMFAVPTASVAACTTRGAKAMPADTPTQGDVDNGQTDAYKLVVPKGKQGMVHVAFLNGDIDISICKVSTARTTKVVCYSHNMAAVGDGCHLGNEGSVPDAADIFTTDYLVQWGPPLGPGTYRMNVKHCFSSKDGEGCDYADDITGEKGAADAAPPIAYVAFFTRR